MSNVHKNLDAHTKRVKVARHRGSACPQKLGQKANKATRPFSPRARLPSRDWVEMRQIPTRNALQDPETRFVAAEPRHQC